MSILSQNIHSGIPSDLMLGAIKINAFKSLLECLIENEDIVKLDGKLSALTRLKNCAEQLECNLENKTTILHWTAIASAFGTATVIAGSTALNPLIGFLMASVSATSAAASISGAMLHNRQAAKVAEQMKRIRIVLSEDALIDWACLWGLTGFELFCNSLLAASKGNLSDFAITRSSKQNALTIAVKFAAQALGLDLPEVVTQLGEIKNGVRPQLVDKIREIVKATLPDTTAVTMQSRIDNVVIGSSPAFERLPQIGSEKNEEFVWIDQVLKMPFRVLTGDSGSGKSTLERFMISKLKTAGYHVVCLNTETNPDLWKGVECLTTADEINDFLSDFIAGIERRQNECRKLGLDEDEFLEKVAANKRGRDGKVAMFFMEANTFELCGVDADLWASVLKMCLTNIRKWGYSACLTAQSDNQLSISSKMKGFADRYCEQPRVECIVKTDSITGEAISSGRGLLKVKGRDDKNPKHITLMNFPKTKDFRTQTEKDNPIDTIPPSHKDEKQPERKLSDVIYSLEKSLEMTHSDTEETVIKTTSELSDIAQRLLSFFNNAKNKEPKSLADIKKKDDIREYGDAKIAMALYELVIAGEVVFDGKDKWYKFGW